mgnify:CR=1 FL=1
MVRRCQITMTEEEEKAIYYYEWRHLEANVINKIQEYDDKGMTVNLANRIAGKTFKQAVHYEDS